MTPTQFKIYQFVTQFIQQRSFAPSLQEIAVGIGISPRSLSLISRYLRVLEQDGLLTMGKKGYRKVQLKTPANMFLPLVGRIAAGAPIEAIPEADIVDMAELLRGEDLYVLEVKGDSMIDEGIWSGDKVICKRQDTAKENDIVVALIDNQNATLKRIHFESPREIKLIPANTALKPQIYAANRVQVQGVFVALLRLHKRG
jgi:repressor LexA